MEELALELSNRAAAAAARGERVVVSKYGCPFVKLVATRAAGGMDFAKAEDVRRALYLDRLTVRLAQDFDDPALSREGLGLQD